ncbi:MAG: MBL fold metallo-hydrolase [Candidatus Hydrogenedentota bacterium]
MFEIEGIKFYWLGHASFRIEAQGLLVYLDPYNVKDYKADADIILITHNHYDHLSLQDINRLKKSDTSIVLPEFDKGSISGTNLVYLKPGASIVVKTINIEGVAAYNTNKAFHPKNNNWLGYIVNISNKRIYHAGDTDVTAEMKNLQNIDIALLPVGGTYTMTANEAALAANTLKPKYVVPMHWGSIVGSKNDALSFSKLVKDSKVIMPQ